MKRTHAVLADPLATLLDAYERHGPVFSLRVLSSRIVFMIGPEANHRILVSHAEDFTWRDGGFADLIPLLGDGLLTIDGDFHRRSRRIMLPAFHSQRIAAALSTMDEEIDRAVAPWRPGDSVELYGWARDLALRVAMRALFGFDPRRPPRRPRPRARVRARARLLRPRLLAPGAARPRHAVGARCSAPARGSTRSCSARSPAAAPPASAGRISSRCCSTPGTRTATASRTATSATRS